MASPKTVQTGSKHTEGNLIDLYFEFPVGAAGAVGTVVRNREIGTIARLGAGNYRIPFSGGWNVLMAHSIQVIDPTPAATDGSAVNISVRTFGVVASLIEFFTRDGANGAAADPRNGAVVSGWLRLQNGQRV